MPTPNGPAIRRHRVEQGIRTRELAARIGVSYVHMANIEKGHNTASIEVIHRIAHALGAVAHELIDHRPPPRPPGPTHPRPTRPPRGDVEAVAS